MSRDLPTASLFNQPLRPQGQHLFLKDWDPTREINSYPPAMGKFALYQKETFYDYFDYTAQAFSDIEDRTIVPTRINSSLHFCMENYRQPYPNPLGIRNMP